MSDPQGLRPASRAAPVRTAGRPRTGERLVALFIVGVALLNFPLLSVVRGRGPVAGVPALFAYLLVVWVLLAVATALVLRRRSPEPGGSGEEPGPRSP